VVQALDADEDGHTAAQCQAAPGNDCDDGNDEIHPNATEACDGVDNDCDELVDLDDGLELAGVTRQADAIGALDLAWIPGEADVQGDEQFRMAFSQTGINELRSATIDSSGALGQEVSQLTRTTDGKHDLRRLAGGTTTFGVTYLAQSRLSTSLVGQADKNGTPSGVTQGTGGSADITRRARGEWILGISDAQGLRIARYLDNGSIVDGPVVTAEASPSWVRIAAQGDASAVVWQLAPNVLRWARLNSDMVASEGVSFGATGYRPDIVASGTGYALAWAVGSGIGFRRAGLDGAKLCENGLVPLGLDEASDSRRVALADSKLGALVLVTSAAGKVVLVRFGGDCSHSIIPVANTFNAGSPAIAAGSGSVALAWINTNTSTAYTRLVGELLCD
jgi:hypothetical protein